MIMKQAKKLIALALFSVIFGSCQKESNISSKEKGVNETLKSNAANFSENGGYVGHVFTLNNLMAGNSVMDYYRGSDGTLTFNSSFSTGGTGTGGGLGNQGAVILTDDHDILLAVNAGSNSISSFRVTSNGLSLVSTVNSGGEMPVSLTQNGQFVFVLNSGDDGNISGFTLNENGMLFSIPNSTRPLSSSSAGGAQIDFIKNGKVLAVTEKATNKITSYTVSEAGIPGTMHTLTSANPTPFGFAVGNQGNIFVSEAVGGAPGASTLSSYHISNDGSISLVDGPVGANQSAACWVVLTGNGKYAYTTNAASDNISSFKITNSSGNISVHEAISASTESGPIDAALSNNSKFLYVLNGGSHSISAYSVENDGSLSNLQTVSGLPVSANGLAAK